MDILLDEMRKREEQGVQKHDFMQILMDSVDENGTKLREMQVVENILSLILGGYESTSDVMMWGLYYLAKHPEILEKLKVYHIPLIIVDFTLLLVSLVIKLLNILAGRS